MGENQEIASLNLSLRIKEVENSEGNSTKATEMIREVVLERFFSKEPDKDCCEYALHIPYREEIELDETIYALLGRINEIADSYSCTTDIDVVDPDSGQSW